MTANRLAPRTAAFFDFNGTLVTREVWDAMRSWKRQHGEWRQIERIAMARQIPIVLASRVGLLSTDLMVRRWMRAAWRTMRGMDEQALLELVNYAWDTMFQPSTRDRVAQIVAKRKSEGRLAILVSATYEPFLEPAKHRFLFDEVIGTRVEVRDGRVTGRVLGKVVTGPEKVNRVMSLVRRLTPPIDLQESLAYADTERDLDLLELVGNPVAVWPNRRLERVAQHRGWPIVRDSEPS